MTNEKVLTIGKKLNWELLKRFNMIVNASSFAEAAKEIGTSQGALATQIDTLEQTIGEPLFVRTSKNRTFELTPAGNLLASITQKMNGIVCNQIQTKFEKTENIEERKLIKIITTPGLSTTLLPKIITEFLKQNHKVKFELITKRDQFKITTGEIIIKNDFISQQFFKMEFLKEIKSSFYASENYLREYGTPASYQELPKHKMLSVQYFNISNIDQYSLNQDTVLYIDPWIQSDYISFLIEMALRDQGIIELPHFHPAANHLVKIPSLQENYVKIHVGYLNIEKQESIFYKFINFLKENI